MLHVTDSNLAEHYSGLFVADNGKKIVSPYFIHTFK